MTFTGSISTCFSKFFVFSGRASRSEYWWWFLFNMIIALLASIADALLFDRSTGPIYGVSAIILFFPGISVFVRRLHDTDHSGWWYWIVLTVVGIIPLFIWTLSKGTTGNNKFGQHPITNSNAYVGAPLLNNADAPDYDRLEKLASLRDRGVVSEEEFSVHKARILGSTKQISND